MEQEVDDLGNNVLNTKLLHPMLHSSKEMNFIWDKQGMCRPEIGSGYLNMMNCNLNDIFIKLIKSTYYKIVDLINEILIQKRSAKTYLGLCLENVNIKLSFIKNILEHNNL